jgi:preprotein translocase subunit YajC
VPEELVSLLPIVGIALLFWLLLIRPASRRQKDLRRLQNSLSVGDEVMLTSGIFGRLTSVEGEHLHVTVSDGVELKVARGAIASVVRDEPADDRIADDQVERSQPSDETNEPGER